MLPSLLAIMDHCSAQDKRVSTNSALTDYALTAESLNGLFGAHRLLLLLLLLLLLHDYSPLALHRHHPLAGLTVLALSQSTSLKKEHFALLHRGREENVKPRMRAGSQRQGTVRWNHDVGKNISAALFKGRTLVAGSVPADVPDGEPQQSSNNKK